MKTEERKKEYYTFNVNTGKITYYDGMPNDATEGDLCFGYEHCYVFYEDQWILTTTTPEKCNCCGYTH